MKKIKAKYILFIILVLCICLVAPSLITRINKENDNRNVTVALLYNDINKKLSKEDLKTTLENYKSIGIDTVAVMEDDLNALVSEGALTCIKYNVLLHKYDDESINVGNAIEEACPNITLDSHVILAKREKAKEMLSYQLERRYGEDDYMFVGNVENMDIYVFYDGQKSLWNYALGYDEDTIKELSDAGFKISLIHKVKNYANTEYLKDIENIVKEYKVEYLNLKKDSDFVAENTGNTQNYKGISDIITENNLTLVVTENINQLSNEKFYGYDYVFNKAAGGKVIRSYETYDDSQADSTNYKYRTSQLFNSTIDRNIRFAVITQISISGKGYMDLSNYTYEAAKDYIQKLADEGYTINGQTKALNYVKQTNMDFALCSAVMVLAIAIMICLVFGKDFNIMCICSAAVALLAFLATLLAPPSLNAYIKLYPTLYSAVMSCFAMTLVLSFIKSFKDKCNTLLLSLGALFVMMCTLLFMSVGMSAMLSGLDYYINNDIFRGIKLSLLAPVAYTALAYLIMFKGKEKVDLIGLSVKILSADIKVYWVILGAVIGFVGISYIIRSGNVESISSAEAAMRNTLTELFTERPRTKEFLVGYPALILLCYYFSKTNLKLVQWLLAVASSILAASVTNSFCHVFTGYKIIVKRTLNGFIVGMAVTLIAIVLNMLIVKIAKYIKNKINEEQI